MFAALLNPIVFMLSLSTATGVLVHDLKIDKLTATVFALPAAVAAAGSSGHAAQLSADLHTHVERNSFSQETNELRGSNPRVQPRTEDKQQGGLKTVERGRRAFDSTYPPLTM